MKKKESFSGEVHLSLDRSLTYWEMLSHTRSCPDRGTVSYPPGLEHLRDFRRLVTTFQTVCLEPPPPPLMSLTYICFVYSSYT